MYVFVRERARLSLYTFRRGDERKRGGRGVAATLFPLHAPFSPLSLSFSLSFPFLSLFLALCRPFSLSLYIRFPARSSIVWCAASHTDTYTVRIPTGAHTRAHPSVSDTRMRYAFLVGCIFQDCGHSYSAPCNMHAVEGADCSARSLRVQRARERDKPREMERDRNRRRAKGRERK